jgi:murein DD-endopeptidase MepM/ murein hydrolase activator NlpD
MIKRSIKICLALIFALILSISNVYAGETLGDKKNYLAALKKQKADNEYAKSKTQAEINSQNNKIANAHSDVEKAEADIEIAKNLIEQSNDKIASTKEESAKLLVFYEIMQGDNEMLSYISGASSMTDFIMRIESVSQILDHNQSKIKELEDLIIENEELQVSLKRKEEELNQKIIEYEANVKDLKGNLSELVEVVLDIDSQIEAQQKIIKYYEDIGCRDDQLISECEASIVNNSRWLKPTDKGYISSDFGYRSFYLNGAPYHDYHNAVDVAGSGAGAKIYPAAGGVVVAVIYRSSCGGNQVYINVTVQGVRYTIFYAHMLDVYVRVGDVVTNQDVIGTVGGGGATLRVNGGWDTCSTGWHLHFGVANGYYLGGDYDDYNVLVAKSIRPPMMPAYGNWYYSRY